MHLQSGGVELRDPALLEIVDTRAGQPLAMADVRETLAHLFGLGRYQDIQVDAALTDAGVVLTYRLVPLQRVRRIAFQGRCSCPKASCGGRSWIATARLPSLRARRRSGDDAADDLSRSRLSAGADRDAGRGDGERGRHAGVFRGAAGVRARIGAIDVQGTSRSHPSVLEQDRAEKRRAVRRRGR